MSLKHFLFNIGEKIESLFEVKIDFFRKLKRIFVTSKFTGEKKTFVYYYEDNFERDVFFSIWQGKYQIENIFSDSKINRIDYSIEYEIDKSEEGNYITFWWFLFWLILYIITFPILGIISSIVLYNYFYNEKYGMAVRDTEHIIE
jgi:hypothetical protein